MARILSYIIGPELIWMLLYGAVTLMAKSNVPPSKSMDNLLESLYLYVPLATLLIFSLWYFPAADKNWLLLRVWIAGVLGAHFVLDKGLGAHSEQGPGIGTAYILGMGLVFFALIAGSVFVKIRV